MIDLYGLINQYGLNKAQSDEIVATYNSLSPTERENFGENDFKLLLQNKGWREFDDNGNCLPLSPPKSNYKLDPSLFGTMPSPGASIMCLLTHMAGEDRRINRDLQLQESKSIVEEMKSEADLIREKAVTQLIIGCVSSAINIASGVVQIGGAVSTLKAGASGALTDGQLGLITQKFNAINTIMQAGATILNSVNQFEGDQFDASLKEMDAKIEKDRADIEALKSINDALTELIHKSLSTAETIQEGVNQTRSRILA
ncbi:MAG: hypothetical protein LBT86_10175 [Deltaproteobacteria bacterium]|jgi:hypothetical protein|nr:hypothetical protein [Deltaproteobacteria bacterium]